MVEYVDTADEVVDQERVDELQAFFTTLARVAGLDELPRVNPDSPVVPLKDARSSIAAVAAANHLPRTLQLDVLARLANISNPDDFSDDDLVPLARALVHPSNLTPDATALQLLKTLRSQEDGVREPLGRIGPSQLASPGGLISSSLRDEIQCTMLTIDVGCDAAQVKVDGTMALSIVTEMYTCKPLDRFEGVINPLKWPDCWLESAFFKSMIPVPGAAKVTTPRPDENGGWRQTLLETVDFGFAIAPDGTHLLHTELDFLYFWNGAANPALGAGPHGAPGSPPRVAFTAPGAVAGAAATPAAVTRSQVPAAGCTYDLKSSYGNRILVDQGFLLVEDLPGQPYRRYRTQKEVRFAAVNPTAAICTFWGLSTATIMQGC